MFTTIESKYYLKFPLYGYSIILIYFLLKIKKNLFYINIIKFIRINNIL